MNASRLGLAAGLALCAQACGATPAARTSLRVDVWNASGAAAAPRPTAITLSWLDLYGFLFKDHVFAVPPGGGDYLGNVLVRIYVTDAGLRRAIVRGQAADQTISEGWGIADLGAGEAELPISITLGAVPSGASDLDDVDQDGVPDPVDNCPGKTNSEQLPSDC